MRSWGGFPSRCSCPCHSNLPPSPSTACHAPCSGKPCRGRRRRPPACCAQPPAAAQSPPPCTGWTGRRPTWGRQRGVPGEVEAQGSGMLWQYRPAAKRLPAPCPVSAPPQERQELGQAALPRLHTQRRRGYKYAMRCSAARVCAFHAVAAACLLVNRPHRCPCTTQLHPPARI